MGCKNCRQEIIDDEVSEMINPYNNTNLKERQTSNNINYSNSNVLKTSNRNIFQNNSYLTNEKDKKEYIKEVLNLINIHRKEHGVSPLTLSQEITEISQKYSEKLSTENDLEFSKNEYKGEELGESLFSSSRPIDSNKLVENWYKQGYKYDFKNINKNQPSHFSQMIWRDTKYFGLGISANENNGYIYFVANYYPGGNIEGLFQDNVFPKINNLNSMQFDSNNDFYDNNNYNNNNDNYSNNIIFSNNNNNINNNIQIDDNFVKEVIEVHNIYREKHHVKPLKLNKNICKIAQEYTNFMAKNNIFQQSQSNYNGDALGENLAMIENNKISGKDIVNNWYNENVNYDYNGDYQSNTGHFTQIVWKDTTDAGFGWAQSDNGIYYIVGNYYPAGNFLGEFKDNVLPP